MKYGEEARKDIGSLVMREHRQPVTLGARAGCPLVFLPEDMGLQA